MQALKPTETQYKVWDIKTPGFGIRVNGQSKSWIVMYGAKRRMKVLGRYPNVSLKDARQSALVILGTRPDDDTRSPKFGEVYLTFLEENYKGKSPRSKYEATRLLKSHFLPEFEETRLAKIRDADITRILAPLKPSEKLHAFRSMRRFLNWATVPPRRYISKSPLQGYEPPGQDNKGTRTLTDQELVKVWKACNELQSMGKLVQLLILWGTRNGETARLERSWLKDEVIVLPRTVTKNRRAHAIPVLPLAKQILEQLPYEGKFYFPGKKAGTHLNDGSWGKFKYELDKVSGVKDWDYRDIRRTFRSNMARLKVPRHIAEILINHVTGTKNELDEIYDQYDYLSEKKEALEKHEQFLIGLGVG